MYDKHGYILSAANKNGGDSTWRSSWFYASMAILGAKNPNLYHELADFYNCNPMLGCEKMMVSFITKCSFKDYFLVHPTHDQRFTRDQLAPLLFMLAAVYKYQKHLRGISTGVLSEIIRIDEKYGNVSKHHSGKIRDNLRYIITKVADQHHVNYKKRVSCAPFVISLSAYEKSWKYLSNTLKPGQLPRPYTIFNNLGMLATVAVIFGIDRDVKSWSKYFKYFGENKWGVLYRIVSGLSYNNHDLIVYKHLKKFNNDIISQRGPDHFNFKLGPYSILDYPVLKAVECEWRGSR